MKNQRKINAERSKKPSELRVIEYMGGLKKSAIKNANTILIKSESIRTMYRELRWICMS